MTRRSTRRGLVDPEPELAALRQARKALCRLLTAYPISGAVYVSAQQALKDNKSTVVDIQPGCRVFLNVLCADAHLVICGAGHIAVPLAQFSQKLGFQVTVLDDRSDFASPARFPVAASARRF